MWGSWSKNSLFNRQENSVKKQFINYAKTNHGVFFDSSGESQSVVTSTKGFTALGGYQDLYQIIGSNQNNDYQAVFRKNNVGYVLFAESDLDKEIFPNEIYFLPNSSNSFIFSKIMQNSPNHRYYQYQNGDYFPVSFKNKFSIFARPDNFYYITSIFSQNLLEEIAHRDLHYIYEFNRDKVLIYDLNQTLPDLVSISNVISTVNLVEKNILSQQMTA